MSHEVRPTARAEADVERLYSAIADRSGTEAALGWHESYVKAVDRLRVMPYTCGIAYKNTLLGLEVRHLLFGTHPARRYRALFTIEDTVVTILAVRAPGERPVSARDLED